MVNSCAGKIYYGKGDYENLRKRLDTVDWIQSLGSCDGDVDQMWDYYKNTLLSRIEQYIPVVSNFCELKKASWKCPLDQKVRKLIRKKSRLWSRYIETRNPHIHKEYKKLRNEVRKQTRLIERKEQSEVAKQCKSNPKKFWKYVSSKSKSQTTIGDINKAGSNGLVSVVNADEDKANVFGGTSTSVLGQWSLRSSVTSEDRSAHPFRSLVSSVLGHFGP